MRKIINSPSVESFKRRELANSFKEEGMGSKFAKIHLAYLRIPTVPVLWFIIEKVYSKGK